MTWPVSANFEHPTLGTDLESFDYHGALVVVETGDDHIVFIHPLGSTEGAGSLSSDPCREREDLTVGAVRIVREKTGLDVVIDSEFVTFIQPGTLTGTMCAHGYVAHVVGGELLPDGSEGPAVASRLDELPQIVPIRVAN